MGCSHTNTMRMNDVKVCLNCGMMITFDGKILFDRQINKPNKKKKRRK